MKKQDQFPTHLQALASKDDEAFKNFIHLYSQMTAGIVFGLLKNREDVEDTLQSIFLKLFQLPQERFPKQGERSWYYTLCVNEAKTFLSRKAKTVSIDEHIDNLPILDESLIDLASEEKYLQTIAGLSELDQTIINLKILGGCTHKEIAKIVNKPEGTVRWHYMRAIHTLRMALSALAIGIISVFILLLFPRRTYAGQQISGQQLLFRFLEILFVLCIVLLIYLGIWAIRRMIRIRKEKSTKHLLS